MKKQKQHSISPATLAALALSLTAYGVSHAQTSTPPPTTPPSVSSSSASSSQQPGSPTTTPGSSNNSTGVIQSDGQQGQPVNDPAAREEERKRMSSDTTASTTLPPPATTTNPVTGTTPSTSTDSTLSPTGKSSSDMTPTAPPALVTAASTVRQAIDANSALSSYSVTVVPQGDHLVLRGSVADAAAAQSVLDFAKLKAGTDVKVESEIQIRK